MDHFRCLEKFRIGNAPLLQIPWLGFDHESQPLCGFSQYPTLHGWTEQRISTMRAPRARDSGPSDTEYMAELSMMQSWLFVGALEAVVCTRIKTTEFVCETKKGQLVHTAFMRHLLNRWQNTTVQRLSQEEKIGVYQRVTDIFSEIQFWCFKLSSLSLSSAAESRLLPIVHPRVSWSSSRWLDLEFNIDCTTKLLTLVGEAICTAKSYLGGGELINNRGGFVGCYTNSSCGQLIGELACGGWCPFTARVLLGYRYSVAEYARFWPKTRTREHEKCSPSRCVAYNIDAETYKTQHRDVNCDCSFSAPSFEDVERILKAGGIPVIGLAIDTSNASQEELSSVLELGDFALTVQDGTKLEPDGGYVAVSHVWSDGLGSNTESGLPRCQLHRLFARTLFFGHKYMWIDSLCVPEEKTMRKKAISLMAATYRGAKKTLVLDRRIEMLSASPDYAKIERTLLHLVVSPWMQRLWTLQEALLSSWLVFEFHDKMVSSFALYSEIFRSIDTDVNPITQALGSEFLRLLELNSQIPPDNKSLELGDVQRMLLVRSTTKPGDETLAVAGLLGIDVHVLVQAPPELRMQKLFQLLKSLPGDILFLDKPRMQQRGWRWAVTSFLPDEATTADVEHIMTLSKGHMVSSSSGQRLSECLEEGGLRGKYVVVKLEECVELDRGWSGVLVKLPDDRLLKIKVCPSECSGQREGPFWFDAIAYGPARGSLKEMSIGVALLSTQEKHRGNIPIYEYRRRILMGNMEVQWFQKEEAIGGNEEEIEVVII